MSKKYELLEPPNVQGLRRIRYLRGGTLGGWIKSEINLSQDGDARVRGDARVTTTLKTATRQDGYTFSLFPCADGLWRVSAGCRLFTLEEAWKHWVSTRDNTPLGEETFDILTMFETWLARQPQLQKEPQS